VRWHHEWWNGSGYPDALERSQIPLAARILRLTDSFCALTVDRPYRAAVSEAEARRYLTEWAGIEFDPAIVKEFLNLKIADEPDTDLQASEEIIETPENASNSLSIFSHS
jgi:HD-GYP domain-containing protein (c-di-GMP phosphodiesterase class II)